MRRSVAGERLRQNVSKIKMTAAKTRMPNPIMIYPCRAGSAQSPEFLPLLQAFERLSLNRFPRGTAESGRSSARRPQSTGRWLRGTMQRDHPVYIAAGIPPTGTMPYSIACAKYSIFHICENSLWKALNFNDIANHRIHIGYFRQQ